MYAHPLFRPLAAAAAAVVAALLLAAAVPSVTALVEGLSLDLVARAVNADRSTVAAWIVTGAPSQDAGRSRSAMARAVDAAHEAGARAIVIASPLTEAVGGNDLRAARALLDGASSSTDAAMRTKLEAWVADLDHDADLEQAIHRAGNVVLLATADGNPLERFANVAAAVATDPTSRPDADGVERQTRLFRADTGLPSLDYAAWLIAHGHTGSAYPAVDPDAMSAAAATLTDRTGRWLPTYGRRAGTPGGVLQLTAETLRGAQADLKGRIVVIGGLESRIAVATGDALPLGEAVTQRVISLERHDYAKVPRLARTVTGLILLAAILFGALVAPGLRRSVRWATVGLIVVGALIAEIGLLALGHLWIPLLAGSLTVPLATLAAALVPVRPRSTPASGAPVIPMPATMPRISRPPRPRPEPPKRPDVPAADPFLTANTTGPQEIPGRRAPAADTAAAPAAVVATVPMATTPLSLKDIQRILEARRQEPSRAEVADMLLGRSKRPPKPKLGRYEIDRELGHGAMGTVFLGKDPTINRTVAIKAIPIVEEFSEADLAEARDRFFREAEMAGRLQHSSIVTVYDAGEDGGIAWIAMEYVQGQTLSDYTVKDRLLPAHRVLEICARVAEALHYAHAQAVVHRDIKPANVLVHPETLETKITDFGIARLTNSSSTRSGIVLGTPSFMAPERLEGRAVTGRSDLFALGVSMYQLLAGELPFRADSMAGLMEKIIHTPHPPLKSLRPDLPACVSAIVDRALQKDPNDRFQSAGEMARFLRACAKACNPTAK
jgi:serine/threonine-protein kinase